MREVVSTILILAGAAATAFADSPAITRLAFGSCAKQDQPQPVWDAIVAGRPEVFLFLGDNIYGDTKASGVVILSGDRHLSEISRLPAGTFGITYPVYDITSSSLNAPSGNFTQAKVRFANEINSYRVGLTFFDVNFGRVLIDWEPADPVVRLQVCDEVGGVVLQQRLTLGQLQYR